VLNLKHFTYALRLRVADQCPQGESEKWNVFLDSHLPAISSIPDQHSLDWKKIFETLTSCLREEKYPNLQYEAVCGIIKLKAHKNLRRWDRIAYAKVLDEMLSLGSPKQKELASVQCLETGDVDVRVIQQLRLGLGDVDEDKRKRSIDILGNLRVEFAPSVVHVLVQDSKHSSWRVRYDVATLLKMWIPRIAPPCKLPPPPRDPDSLETDSEETLKALFSNESWYTEQKNDSILLNGTIFSDYFGEDGLHDRCVQLLLELMNTDWSFEVRNAAAHYLTDLKLGKPVLDWILNSLSSEDPTRRVDALKCLTQMAVIPQDRLDAFVRCFKDPYSSVKIEACRVACSLKSNNPKIVMALLDMLDDLEFKVRAYAIKGD
jgi:hypothetical protein